MPTNVLIAGGGPAGMEAALALHRLAGDRVATTVLAPEADFTYRPLSVLAPFAEGGPLTYPLARFADDAGFTHVRGRLAVGRHRRARGAHRDRRAAALRRAADRLRRAPGGAVRRRRRVHRLADRPGAPARDRPGRRGRPSALARVRRPAGRHVAAPALRARADARRPRVRDGHDRRPALRHPRGGAARGLPDADPRSARPRRHQAAHSRRSGRPGCSTSSAS